MQHRLGHLHFQHARDHKTLFFSGGYDQLVVPNGVRAVPVKVKPIPGELTPHVLGDACVVPNLPIRAVEHLNETVVGAVDAEPVVVVICSVYRPYTELLRQVSRGQEVVLYARLSAQE
jgi:hypothetical protein